CMPRAEVGNPIERIVCSARGQATGGYRVAGLPRRIVQKQERRAGWPGLVPCSSFVGAACSVVPADPKLFVTARRFTSRRNLLHHQRKVLKFLLQDRKSATRHLDTPHSVKRGLRRNSIAPAHQENLH